METGGSLDDCCLDGCSCDFSTDAAGNILPYGVRQGAPPYGMRGGQIDWTKTLKVQRKRAPFVSYKTLILNVQLSTKQKSNLHTVLSGYNFTTNHSNAKQLQGMANQRPSTDRTIQISTSKRGLVGISWKQDFLLLGGRITMNTEKYYSFQVQ